MSNDSTPRWATRLQLKGQRNCGNDDISSGLYKHVTGSKLRASVGSGLAGKRGVGQAWGQVLHFALLWGKCGGKSCILLCLYLFRIMCNKKNYRSTTALGLFLQAEQWRVHLPLLAVFYRFHRPYTMTALRW